MLMGLTGPSHVTVLTVPFFRSIALEPSFTVVLCVAFIVRSVLAGAAVLVSGVDYL